MATDMPNKKNRRQILKYGASMAALGTLAGCSEQNPSEDRQATETTTGGATTEKTTSEGEETVIRLPRPNEPLTLEPAMSRSEGAIAVGMQVYEGLYRMSADAELEPQVASELPEIPDNQTYIVPLRDNVYTANETHITAEDVKASLDFVIDPENESPKRGSHSFVESVEIVDEYTVQINLNEPHSPALNTFASLHGFRVVPKETREGITLPDSPYSNAVDGIGTGPYDLVSWKSGDELVFEKNEHYWGDGLPKTDRLVMKVIEDPSTRYTRFIGGELDMMVDPAPNHVPQLQNREGVTGKSIPSVSAAFMCFSCEQPPFDDWRLRRGVVHAINREKLVERAYNGLATPTHGFAPPDTRWYTDEVEQYTEYDLDKAKSFFEEAGEPELEFQITTEQGVWASMSEILAEELSKIGVTANINEYSHEGYVETRRGGASGLTIQVITQMSFDFGAEMLRVGWHPRGSTSWLTRYEGQEYQEALEQYLTASSVDEKFERFHELSVIGAEKAPYTHPLYTDNVSFWHDYITDYDLHPYALGGYNLKHAQINR